MVAVLVNINNLTKEELIEAIDRANGGVVREPDGSVMMFLISYQYDSKYDDLYRYKNGWRIEGKRKVFATKEEAAAAIYAHKADVD